MATHAEVAHLTEIVSGWERVTTVPHRFGGVEFTLENVEIGHLHSNGMVDIPFTRAVREALVNDGQALPHHILPESGWITFMMTGEKDIAHASRLFRLSYLQKRARRDKSFALSSYRQELGELEFSPDVLTALGVISVAS